MNSTSPLSILISVHNAESTLERCFQSLADQTFQDFQIVCIDDASRDGSLRCIQKWKSYFQNRFLLITQKENKGLTRSLNEGLKIIDTQYTARIDGDDWWDPRKLELQLEYLQTHPDCGLLGTGYANVYAAFQKNILPPISDSKIKNQIFGYNPFAHSTVIFDTALVQKLQGYDEKVYFGQDYDLWLRMLPHTKFANLAEILCYRTADSGISKEKQNAQIRQYIKTQWKYMRLYSYPVNTYLHFFRPLAVLLTPSWVKKIKYTLGR